MEAPKILLIEPDTLSRLSIAAVLQNDRNYEVVSVSDDIEQVENTISKINPDLVVLSVDQFSVGEEGIFKVIRFRFPGLPIIVLSNRDEKGAEAAITSLEAGAIDFITKPVKHALIPFAFHHFEDRLISSINTILEAGQLHKQDSRLLESLLSTLQTLRSGDVHSKSLVVIGASHGGIHALFELIAALPADLNTPIIIVQHAPQIFTRILAGRLRAKSALEVSEAYDGAVLGVGKVWIAPGGHHTIVARLAGKDVLKVHHGTKINNVRPSIDLLFESAAHLFGRDLLGILLSGAGNDGIAGCRAIKNAGGQILVQDPRCSKAPHLPLAVLKEGIASGCFTPKELAEEILKRVKKEKASF